uniref:Uncharacterized protein n=1 Tax=Cucumis melo TaxID=3656 RepID=A0A9I9E729_CUCME
MFCPHSHASNRLPNIEFLQANTLNFGVPMIESSKRKVYLVDSCPKDPYHSDVVSVHSCPPPKLKTLQESSVEVFLPPFSLPLPKKEVDFYFTHKTRPSEEKMLGDTISPDALKDISGLVRKALRQSSEKRKGEKRRVRRRAREERRSSPVICANATITPPPWSSPIATTAFCSGKVGDFPTFPFSLNFSEILVHLVYIGEPVNLRRGLERVDEGTSNHFEENEMLDLLNDLQVPLEHEKATEEGTIASFPSSFHELDDLFQELDISPHTDHSRWVTLQKQSRTNKANKGKQPYNHDSGSKASEVPNSPLFIEFPGGLLWT